MSHGQLPLQTHPHFQNLLFIYIPSQLPCKPLAFSGFFFPFFPLPRAGIAKVASVGVENSLKYTKIELTKKTPPTKKDRNILLQNP